METLTSASSNTEKLMAKESILGGMARCTTASGTKVSNKGMEFGRASKVTPILESGPLPKHMATEFICGQTAIDMKANGKCASNMAKALIVLQMEMSTPVSTLMESHTAKVNMFGPRDKFTPVNFSKVKNMEKVNGGVLETPKIAMCTKVTTKMIGNTEKECLLGQAETFTKVITLKTRDRATGRCSGRMVACMRESGSAVSSTGLDE